MRSPNDVKYVRITDFGEDGIPAGHEFVTAETVELTCRLEEEDVLFARSGATAGKTFIFTEDIAPAVFAGYCIRFRFDRKRILPWFVYFYTKTQRYEAWVRSIQRPSGQPNINKEEFKSFRIPVPDIEVQRRLVTNMLGAREARKRNLDQADALLSGMDTVLLAQLSLTLPAEDNRLSFAIRLASLNSARLDAHFFRPPFGKLLTTLLRTRHKKLGDVARLSHQQSNPQDMGGETFRYIEIGGVNRMTGEVSVANVATSEAPSRARMIVQKGDIIVSLTRPHHGSIALIDDELAGCIASTGFAIIREITDPSLDPRYLLTVLRSQICLRQMLQRSSGGNYPAITEDELLNILIPVPATDIQLRITEEFSRRHEEARRLRAEAAKEWEEAKANFERQLLAGNQ